ncbi:hypothetical protein [Pseudomonas pseudonitroreducens]|uniref:hypothetical protein n=1 Tax=Pseudomonas pseudonitroreducens TaxID=2892326 RepID=UPI001F1E2EEA|nr:hypothetical protein [Pseudomonas pseudonitroreducens]
MIYVSLGKPGDGMKLRADVWYCDSCGAEVRFNALALDFDEFTHVLCDDCVTDPSVEVA